MTGNNIRTRKYRPKRTTSRDKQTLPARTRSDIADKTIIPFRGRLGSPSIPMLGSSTRKNATTPSHLVHIDFLNELKIKPDL